MLTEAFWGRFWLNALDFFSASAILKAPAHIRVEESPKPRQRRTRCTFLLRASRRGPFSGRACAVRGQEEQARHFHDVETSPVCDVAAIWGIPPTLM